jgi:hypothetical protein
VKSIAAFMCAIALLVCVASCGAGAGESSSSTSDSRSKTSFAGEGGSSSSTTKPEAALPASSASSDRAESKSGKVGGRQGVPRSAEAGPASKGKAASVVDRLLKGLTSGKKHGPGQNGGGLELKKILAQARKEGVRVIRPGVANGNGASEGIARILQQLRTNGR